MQIGRTSAVLTIVLIAVATSWWAWRASVSRAEPPSAAIATPDVPADGTAVDHSGAPLAAPPAASTAVERRTVAATTCSLEVEAEFLCESSNLIGIGLRAQPSGLELGERKTSREARWSGLLPGEYVVHVTEAGWQPLAQKVELQAGSDPHELHIQVRPLTQIQGFVIDALSRKPLQEFSVTPHWRGGDGEAPLDERHLPIPMRSLAGEFCFGGFVPSERSLRLVISADGYESASTPWVKPAVTPVSRDNLVELVPSSEVIAQVFGTVRSPDGRPLEGAEVLALPGDVPPSDVLVLGGSLHVGKNAWSESETEETRNRARTDANGSFRIECDAGPEIGLVAYEARYQLASSGPHAVRAGENGPFDLTLPRGNSLHGDILISEEARKTLGSLTVSVMGAADERLHESVDGDHYHITGLADGDYRVSLTAVASDRKGHDYVRTLASELVALSGGEDETIDLHFGSGLVGVELGGHVKWDPEAAIARWTVALCKPGGPIGPARVTEVRDDGTYTLTEVLDGKYFLGVMGWGLEAGERALTLRQLEVIQGRASQPLDFDLSRPVVRFSVKGYSPNTSIEALRLRSLEDDADWQRVVADRGSWLPLTGEGAGTYFGLPPGRYVVEVVGGSGQAEFVIPVSAGEPIDVSIE
jgi:hypothetical protein